MSSTSAAGAVNEGREKKAFFFLDEKVPFALKKMRPRPVPRGRGHGAIFAGLLLFALFVGKVRDWECRWRCDKRFYEFVFIYCVRKEW